MPLLAGIDAHALRHQDRQASPEAPDGAEGNPNDGESPATIAINYGTATNGRTYFADWRADFISGNHPDNTGGFYPGSLSGTQYALSSGVEGHTAGFIAGGSLNYTLFSPPAPALYGQLDSLGFGDQIVSAPSSGFSFNTG